MEGRCCRILERRYFGFCIIRQVQQRGSQVNYLSRAQYVSRKLHKDGLFVTNIIATESIHPNDCKWRLLGGIFIKERMRFSHERVSEFSTTSVFSQESIFPRTNTLHSEPRMLLFSPFSMPHTFQQGGLSVMQLVSWATSRALGIPPVSNTFLHTQSVFVKQ
jgi:hypothetical protein